MQVRQSEVEPVYKSLDIVLGPQATSSAILTQLVSRFVCFCCDGTFVALKSKKIVRSLGSSLAAVCRHHLFHLLSVLSLAEHIALIRHSSRTVRQALQLRYQSVRNRWVDIIRSG